MTNEIANLLAGVSHIVFEIIITYQNKTTGKRRDGGREWVWAKTQEEARDYAMFPYRHLPNDDKYLETADLFIRRIEVVADPNPATKANIAKGKPFRFGLHEPGLLFDKWGY